MDHAQGESGGGKSLTSKLKAKVPHPRVKGKVKNLKNFLPGMKKHNGDEEPHEDSSEYDENSPRGTGTESGYNVGDSTPFTTTKTTPDSISPREAHNSDYDARPTKYDAQYMSSPPTRPAPLATDSPRSNLAPTLEEKFQYLDTRDKTRSPQTVVDSSLIDRGHRPEQYQNYSSSPYTPSDRSYEPKPQQPSSYSTSTPIDRSYEPKPQEPSYYNSSTASDRSYEPKPQQPPSYSSSTPSDRSYESRPEQPSSYSPTTPIDPEPQQPSSYFSSTPTDRSYEPKPSSYSPTAESVQKGYSDVPRNSYRATSMPNPANKGMLDKVKETVAGATAVLGDKMGYYNDHAPADPNAPSIVDKAKSTLGMDKPRDPNAPSILDKAKSTLGMDKPRDPYAPSVVDKAKSTLGLDKPRDPNAPSIVEQAKSTLGMDKPRDPYAPSVVDKAKSTLGLDKPRDPNAPSIVEKAKSTLGMDKPRDPNAPPLTERAKSYMAVASQKTREYSATAADRAAWTKDRVAAQTTPTHHDKALSEQVTQSLSALPAVLKERVFGTASGPSANASSSPSIVNRVSGAVSSLFSSPPKDTQHTFPAHSDYHAAPADRSSVPERMPATSAYSTVNN